MTGARRLTAAITLATLAALGTGACTSPPPARHTADTPAPEPSATPTDPSDILALAGLALPESATDITAESLDSEHPDDAYTYHVSFTAPADGVAAFTRQAVGGDPEELSGITTDQLTSDHTALGISSVPHGSREHTRSVDTVGGRGNLTILLEGPDLTTVHVGISANTR